MFGVCSCIIAAESSREGATLSRMQSTTQAYCKGKGCGERGARINYSAGLPE